MNIRGSLSRKPRAEDAKEWGRASITVSLNVPVRIALLLLHPTAITQFLSHARVITARAWTCCLFDQDLMLRKKLCMNGRQKKGRASHWSSVE